MRCRKCRKHVFVDGRDRLDTPCDCDAVIGGDGLVLSIAAASIIAKVSRDRLMCKLAQDCPGYGFEQHKGYGVPEHLAALDRLGPTVHHRRFFAPVAAAREKHQAMTIDDSASSASGNLSASTVEISAARLTPSCLGGWRALSHVGDRTGAEVRP